MELISDEVAIAWFEVAKPAIFRANSKILNKLRLTLRAYSIS